MPRLDESTDALLRVGSDAQKHVRRVWHGFSDFVLRDNVLEVSMGLIIAGAFTKVVTSFISDIVLPIISLLPFLSRNLDDKFAVLKPGPSYVSDGYNTLQQARDDGALVMAYGAFLNQIGGLFGICLALYGVAKLLMSLSHDGLIKSLVPCRYCGKKIHEALAGWKRGSSTFSMSELVMTAGALEREIMVLLSSDS
ncbi:hypothetical protein DTO212C5_3125 [Paecilomyces variotii]|nr:hypothetical protein DTO212C5_3125 [Paecilomyces variotii]